MATVPAARGLDVVVLERQYGFRDRVRGENMQPWGVAEMRQLGLEDVLIYAGGGYCDRAILRCTFTPAGRARRGAVLGQTFTDPRTLAILLAPLAGPDAAPAEVFSDENTERILALA